MDIAAMHDFHPEKQPEQEKIYYGTLTLFYKKSGGQTLFLVVENTKTGNVSFVAGAAEDSDRTLEASAQREISEELGLSPDEYRLLPTDVTHEFVFGQNKPERAGHHGSYQVFLADVSTLPEISHTAELKSAHWMTKEETLRSLSFPDLQEVFRRAAELID